MTAADVPVRRALLSVTDKSGLVPLAQALVRCGCELISTGGTARELQAAALAVTDISAVSGNPEAFGGRMKTISFAVESALLFDRERDAAEARRLGVAPIDLVVCNLYPFGRFASEGADLATLIENLDIGGPTMIRAAAKNHRWVAVMTDPADYPAVIAELDEHSGALSAATRLRLMLKAFDATADYDALVSRTLHDRLAAPTLRPAYEAGLPLRYGENSHQKAWLHRERGARHSLCDLVQLHGKELSYNNVVDLHAALEAIRDLAENACAVIKHATPCGLAAAAPSDLAAATPSAMAAGDGQRRVLAAAWAGDPLSAFGSVIAFNRPLTRAAVEFFDLDHARPERRKFVEVVAAPAVDDDALALLRTHRNLRVVAIDPADLDRGRSIRVLAGAHACLVQDADDRLLDGLRVVTTTRPALDDRALFEFGLTAVRQVKSNAIVVVRRLPDGTRQLLGMGGGQPNRVDSVRLAIERSRANLETELAGNDHDGETCIKAGLAAVVLVSDAFFPFPDSIELIAAAGIRTVLQPGGSLRDRQVIEACDRHAIGMLFTGLRHFKH